MTDPGADDGSESHCDETLAKVCKCSGKRSKEWKILTEMNRTHERAQEALTVFLQKQ